MPSSLMTLWIRVKFSTLRMRLGILTILFLTLASVSLAVFARMDISVVNRRDVASDLKTQRQMGKHLAPVTVQIDTNVRIPQYENQELVLTGYVTLNKQIDGEVRYQ